MEVSEYLNNSREQRKRLIQTAEKLVTRYSLKEPRNREDKEKLGPCPMGFKDFKDKVNEGLKKMFNPGLTEVKARRFGNKSIEKVYSGDINKLKIERHNRKKRISGDFYVKASSFNIRLLFKPVLSLTKRRRGRSVAGSKAEC